jgi:hypothetical protein
VAEYQKLPVAVLTFTPARPVVDPSLGFPPPSISSSVGPEGALHTHPGKKSKEVIFDSWPLLALLPDRK